MNNEMSSNKESSELKKDSENVESNHDILSSQSSNDLDYSWSLIISKQDNK